MLTYVNKYFPLIMHEGIMSIPINAYLSNNPSDAQGYTFVRLNCTSLGVNSEGEDLPFKISGFHVLDASGCIIAPDGLNVSDIGTGDPLSIVDGSLDTSWSSTRSQPFTSTSDQPFVELVFSASKSVTVNDLDKYVIQTVPSGDSDKPMASEFNVAIRTAGSLGGTSNYIVLDNHSGELGIVDFPSYASTVFTRQPPPNDAPGNTWTHAAWTAPLPASPPSGTISPPLSVGTTTIDISSGGGVLDLTATLTGSTLALAWKDSLVRQYTILSSIADGPYQVASTGKTTRKYTAKRLTPGTRYIFRVRAINDSNPSSYAVATVTTAGAAPVFPPITPDSISVKGTGLNEITIRWSNKNDDETWFRIFRGTPSIDNTYIDVSEIAVVGSLNNTYVDATVTTGRIYGYCVSAVNLSGESSPTEFVDANSLSELDVDRITAQETLANNGSLIMFDTVNLILGEKHNRADVETIVSVIDNGGKYKELLAAGITPRLSKSELTQLALLVQTTHNSAEFINSQFKQAEMIFSRNNPKAVEFVRWAWGDGGSVGASYKDVLAATSTTVDKQNVIDWMRTNGLMQ